MLKNIKVFQICADIYIKDTNKKEKENRIMGMSASQARLIALTARMNDTEYEAQQINQQRLVLANKMNEVYEQLCNMEVPVPPSKIDFAVENYSGKLNGTKTFVRRNSNGQFVAYQETSGVVTKTTTGTKGGDVRVTLGEDIPTTTVVTGEEDNKYGVVGEGHTPTHYVSSSSSISGKEIKENPDKYTGKTFVALNANGEYEIVKPEDMSDTAEYFEMVSAEEYDKLSDEQKSSFKTGVADKNETTVKADLGTSIDGIYVVNGEGDKMTVTPLSQLTDAFYQDKDGHYFLTNTDIRIKRVDPNGSPFLSTEVSDDSTVTSADGKKTGTVSEIAACKDKPGFAHALEGLKHSNPDASEADLESRFMAVSYNDGSFAFVLRSDYKDGDSSVYIYEIDENGKYEQEMERGKYEIKFSPSGSIQSIETTDGVTAILSSEQRFNEWDYEEACAEYKYQKAVYDQDQNRLNKQTEVFQRQDKQLELKLTRLDNERNALNTEIEAVKKVIQDSIERGFKTFSG